MKEEKVQQILKLFEAEEVLETELIQSLWSGYGEILRLTLKGGTESSIIVKNINLSSKANHPRGWNTDNSHLRKLKSYEVELEWYKNWAKSCDENCRLAKAYYSSSEKDSHLLVMEDLDLSGFPIRKLSLDISGVKLALKWLAHFHAKFMGSSPVGLWQEGSYWHLDTRRDEWEVMAESDLKDKAEEIALSLKEAKYQTIIHGDAKVANFCFSEDMQSLAAVDFQYVGGGCGMKDVVYFMGSCLDEYECEKYEEKILDYYFQGLKIALSKKGKAHLFKEIEKEWRGLYAFAWADFSRFLLGWMPEHQKLNGYSKKMVDRAKSTI